METKFNYVKMRCIKKAWMAESQWSWHLVFTDRMADPAPKFGVLERLFSFMQTNFGNCLNEQGPNGPNIELITNDTA